MIVGERQPLLLTLALARNEDNGCHSNADGTTSSSCILPNESTPSNNTQFHSISVRPNSRRTLWKCIWLGGICVTLLATLFALYTSTSTRSFHDGDASSSMTGQERSLLNHYYGPFLMMTILESSSSLNALLQQLRNAQQTADTTIRELNMDSTTSSRSSLIMDTAVDESQDEDTHQDEMDDESAGDVRHRWLRQEPEDSKHHGHHHHHDDDENAAPPIGCETTIVLIRHCEKELIAEHCAYNGYERSVYLSTLFGDTDTAKYPKPKYIFAESPISRNTHSHKMNFREVETVGPLSETLHVPIDDSYTDETIHDLSRHLKESIKKGHFCGQVIVVVWKHTRIAELAHSLGCGPIQGCPIDYSGKTFDQLWQIRYVYTNEFTHSTHKHHFLHHPADNVYWKVFGSIQSENFDPLAFSKLRGDYYDSSSPSTTDGLYPKQHAWQEQVVSYPERSYSTDTAGWKMTMLGLSNSNTNENTVDEP